MRDYLRKENESLLGFYKRITDNRKEYVSVFKPKNARKLLKMGHVIVDIKADKNNSDRTIFIFKNTDKFKEDLATLGE